jgi:hypothetical protein
MLLTMSRELTLGDVLVSEADADSGLEKPPDFACVVEVVSAGLCMNMMKNLD